MKIKLTTLVGLLVAGTLVVAGCGSADSGSMADGSPSSGGDAAGGFNDVDVRFATDMIPHHRQAVTMAELATARAGSSEVKDLAAQIIKAQDPEIQAMSGWLTTWDQPVPSDDSSDMEGMDMSGSASMTGMMSEDQMRELGAASGAGFDKMFLTMMIAHHQGAIEMAETEQADGQSDDAIALAKQIESAQTEEIATMQELLG